MSSQPAAGVFDANNLPPGTEYLEGEAEHAYEHQQMWGAYWTGARLLLGAWAMLNGCFVFAYVYLRNLNSENDWKAHSNPSLLLGAVVLSCVIVSAAVATYSGRRLRTRAAALDWLVGSGIALGLALAAAGFQMWDLGRLDFQPGRSGYGSLFVGWQPVMIFAFLGGAYWLETLMARAVRHRRLVRPIATAVRDEDVTMFRGSLDGFGVFWNFVAFTEVIVFILFYVVH